jgi:hypothetical protein
MVDMRSSKLPMGTSPGTPDTKLSRAVGGGRLGEGIWRRLYSNEVAGRGPGPRRPGGAMVLTADRGGRVLEVKLQINLSLPLPPQLLGL